MIDQPSNSPAVDGRAGHSSLEAARQTVAAAVAAWKRDDMRKAADEAKQRVAKGLSPLKRLGGEPSDRAALRALSASAALGLASPPLAAALKVFSAYWTGGKPDDGALALPSPIVLAKWLGGQYVAPLEKAEQYTRRSGAVADARAAVVAHVRKMHQTGVSLDVCIRTMLDVAVRAEGAEGEALAVMLRAARDPRGGRRVGAFGGLPSEKSLWRWVGLSGRGPDSLVPKSSARRAYRPAWAPALAELVAAMPGASVIALHGALCERLASAGVREPPSHWAVRRWLGKPVNPAQPG